MKIAIASGKGGTGKTTVSTNLAAYWALSRPVFLVDLDVEEPNAALFFDDDLGKQPGDGLIRTEPLIKAVPNWQSDNCILCGQCQKLCAFSAVMKLGTEIMVFPALCHSCYACSELCPTSSLPMLQRTIGELRHWRKGELDYNLDFIEGRLAVGEEQAVPAIKQVLIYQQKHQQKHLDKQPPGSEENPAKRLLVNRPIVILDSPPGTSCPVVEVVGNADFVLLVTEPTPFGLHDLRLAVDLVRSMDKEFAVVINRDGVGDDAVDHYCADEHIDVIARIPQSRDMAVAYSSGKLLFEDFSEMEHAVSGIVSFFENRPPTREA